MIGRLGDVTWTDLWNLAPRPIIATIDSISAHQGRPR